MEQITSCFLSPLGWLKLQSNGHALLSLSFEGLPGLSEDHPFHRQCHRELLQYFHGERFQFDFVIEPLGTEFQQKVWQVVSRIPFGSTISYHKLAQQLGNEYLQRAVGHANARNPLPVIIPCHRVIGADGALVGYGGGLWRKQWLLDHERSVRYGIQGNIFD